MAHGKGQEMCFGTQFTQPFVPLPQMRYVHGRRPQPKLTSFSVEMAPCAIGCLRGKGAVAPEATMPSARPMLQLCAKALPATATSAANQTALPTVVHDLAQPQMFWSSIQS